MSNITYSTIDQVQKQKDIILNALNELRTIIYQTDDSLIKERFRSYVSGHIEQACCDSGRFNICIESIVKDMEESIESNRYCNDCDELREDCDC